jgi:hypothetical protein
MQRSGSRWYYDMSHDLMVEAGCPKALDIREKYNLDFLTFPRCNLTRLYPWRLRRLDRVGRESNTFLVKSHRPPTFTLRRLLASGRFKAIYIYRDLRDVLLSGLEEGEKMRTTGKTERYFGIWPYRSFARLYTVKGACLWARWQLFTRWRKWTRCPGLLTTRYEDLLADTRGQLRRLADHLELDVSDEQIQRVVDKYRRDKALKGMIEKPKPLNKGVIGRHREVFTPQQLAICQKRLGRCLEEMGYVD